MNEATMNSNDNLPHPGPYQLPNLEVDDLDKDHKFFEQDYGIDDFLASSGDEAPNGMLGLPPPPPSSLHQGVVDKVPTDLKIFNSQTRKNCHGRKSSPPHVSRRADRKRRKDKDIPRRPLNAFQIFFKEERQRILDDVSIKVASHEELDTMIDYCWRDLPEEEKEHYRKEAQKESAAAQGRFSREGSIRQLHQQEEASQGSTSSLSELNSKKPSTDRGFHGDSTEGSVPSIPTNDQTMAPNALSGMPQGLEVDISDHRGRRRRYRVEYQTYKTTKVAAERYIQSLTHFMTHNVSTPAFGPPPPPGSPSSFGPPLPSGSLVSSASSSSSTMYSQVTNGTAHLQNAMSPPCRAQPSVDSRSQIEQHHGPFPGSTSNNSSSMTGQYAPMANQVQLPPVNVGFGFPLQGHQPFGQNCQPPPEQPPFNGQHPHFNGQSYFNGQQAPNGSHPNPYHGQQLSFDGQQSQFNPQYGGQQF